MTIPTPPFFSSSILENYPTLNSAGPAPGIPLVIQLMDRVVWFPYSAYGLKGDDAIWGNVAIALAEASPFCNKVVAAFGQFQFNSIAGSSGNGALEIPAYGFLFEGQHFGTQFNMNVPGIAVWSHGTTSLLGNIVIQGNGSKIKDFVVDGSAVVGNVISSGADVGDVPDMYVDFVVQNFLATGTTTVIQDHPLGAVGFGVSNRVTWTEKLHGRIVVNNCLNAIQYGTYGSADSTSHMYSDMEYHVNLQAHQNGLVCARQGHIENGRLRLFGNFQCDSNPSSSSVIVLGVGGQQAHFFRVRLEVYVESDPGSSPIGNTPATITYGSNSGNVIQGCHGYMRYLDGFQSSNVAITDLAPFVFFGPVVGDSVLSGVNQDAGIGFADLDVSSPHVPATGFYDGAGGIYSSTGDYFTLTLTANVTINLAPNPGGGVPGGGFSGNRRILIQISQLAGGGKTVTWPHPGSPTVGNPTVVWPGGVAPTMTAAAFASDLYELNTFNGIIWYGRVVGQNFS